MHYATTARSPAAAAAGTKKLVVVFRTDATDRRQHVGVMEHTTATARSIAAGRARPRRCMHAGRCWSVDRKYNDDACQVSPVRGGLVVGMVGVAAVAACMP